MKGFGIDEDILIEILVLRINKEIRDINRVYREELKRDLVKDIILDIFGDFWNVLFFFVKGDWFEDFGVNEDLVDLDVRVLYEVGERRKGIDVNVFNIIFIIRSYLYFCRVF